MINRKKMAVLSGVMLVSMAMGNVVPALASQQGETMETAVIVPAPVPAGPGSAGPAAGGSSENQSGVPAQVPAGPGTQPEAGQGGGSTVIIRTGEQGGQSSGQGSQIDFSKGPGYNYDDPGTQEPVPEDINQRVSLQEVTDPIVKVTDKYSFDQMAHDAAQLQQRYGSKMQIQSIGTSLDGRVIYDYIIGNPNAAKHIMIQGGIHAREYINPLLMMQQMELALANYDTGSINGKKLSELLNQTAIHFLPMTNPDGIALSQFGPDAIQSQELKEAINNTYATDRAINRGNADLSVYYSRWKANARGVDLNSNFDALWDQVTSPQGISYAGFKGFSPGSEPETQALMNVYQNPAYSWKAVLHYHSMGNVLYWDIPGNKVQGTSQELANLISAATGGYRLLPSNGGGGYKDWIQLHQNPVPSVTIETGAVACPIPVSEYPQIWDANRYAWIHTLEWVCAR